MNELNLLLKHQISHRSNKVQRNYPEKKPKPKAYYEEYSSSSVCSSKSDASIEEQCENLKIELANVQVEESAALEDHKMLADHYNLLEITIEQILNHIDCVILEIKSTERLSSWLHSLSSHEHLQVPPLLPTYDFSAIENIREKLLVVSNNDEEECQLKSLFNEFEMRQKNFKLALKNFKIILDIINVDSESLRNLKQQFEKVLTDYQQCRCFLNHELPYVTAEKRKVLTECLSFLGEEGDRFMAKQQNFGKLLKDIANGICNNACLAKHEGGDHQG